MEESKEQISNSESPSSRGFAKKVSAFSFSKELLRFDSPDVKQDPPNSALLILNETQMFGER